jgi:hypothetical protein
MDYSHISSFLSKFKKIISDKEEVYGVICSVISKHLLMQIKKEDIKIKGAYIKINASPMLLSEILVHKTGILKDLENLIPDRKFKDIV